MFGRTVQQFGHLDVLVNNAAILYDTFQSATDADLEVVGKALTTNLYGPGCCVRRSFHI